MNNIIFGQYYKTNSWIHKLDPRVKLVGLILLIASLFIIDNIIVLFSFLLALFIAILMTKVPLTKYFKSLRSISFILVLTFIFQILFHPEGDYINSYELNLTLINLGIIIIVLTLWIFLSKYIKYFKNVCLLLIVFGLFALQYYFKIGPLLVGYTVDLYLGSIINATFFVVRIIALLFISSLLTLTTTPTEINNGLEILFKPLKKIGIKVSSFNMIIAITLRFIPNLILEAQKVLKAQSSRGADFQDGNLFERALQVVSLIIPMFVIAYKKSVDLGNAMDARGYIPEAERSSIYLLEYKKADYIIYVLLTFTLILVITFRIIL